MKSDIPFEKFPPVIKDVKLFIDLPHEEKLYWIDHYHERMKVIHEDQTAKLEDLLDTVEALANMILWTLRLQEMEKLGWDINRRDKVFFATLEMRDGSVTKEQSEQVFSLAGHYLTGAEKARKKGKFGEAEKLTNIFHRQVKWLMQDQEIL